MHAGKMCSQIGGHGDLLRVGVDGGGGGGAMAWATESSCSMSSGGNARGFVFVFRTCCGTVLQY